MDVKSLPHIFVFYWFSNLENIAMSVHLIIQAFICMTQCSNSTLKTNIFLFLYPFWFPFCWFAVCWMLYPFSWFAVCWLLYCSCIAGGRDDNVAFQTRLADANGGFVTGEPTPRSTGRGTTHNSEGRTLILRALSGARSSWSTTFDRDWNKKGKQKCTRMVKLIHWWNNEQYIIKIEYGQKRQGTLDESCNPRFILNESN